MNTETLLLISLILGATAWLLPFIGFWRVLRGNPRGMGLISCISLSASGISLWLLTLYQTQLVALQAWGDLEDTASGVSGIGGALILVTVVLNAALRYLARRKNAANEPSGSEDHA